MRSTASRILRAGRLAAVATIAAGALVLSGCAATDPAPSNTDGSQGPIDLTVAYGNSAANYLNMYVAWKQGFFEENGLNVDQPFNAQQSGAVDVLLSGDADVIIEGGPQVLTAVGAGADLKILGSTVNKYTFVVLSPTNISSLDDLVGKKLAISAPGGSVSRSAAVLLENKGLSDKVELQSIADLATRLAALQQGQVDGIVISPPVKQLTDTGDFHVIYDMTEDPDMEFVLTSIATTGKFLDANPEALRRFILSLYQAEQWIRDPANRDAALADLAELTGTEDAGALEEGLDYQLKAGEKDLQFSQKAMDASVKQVENSEEITLDLDGVIDLDILTEVLKSVGVDQVIRD